MFYDTLEIIYGKATDIRDDSGIRATVSYQGKRKGSISTDAQGFFEIKGLLASQYELAVEHPGCEYLPVKSVIVHVGTGDKIAINTQLENTVIIYGSNVVERLFQSNCGEASGNNITGKRIRRRNTGHRRLSCIKQKEEELSEIA